MARTPRMKVAGVRKNSQQRMKCGGKTTKKKK